jgi:hypothetical protein
MKTIPVIAVGASDAPIVNAIRQSQPAFVFFLCSTGQGQAASDQTRFETIVPSLAQSAKRPQISHELLDRLRRKWT